MNERKEETKGKRTNAERQPGLGKSLDKESFTISPPPHIKEKIATPQAMYDVVIALIPAFLVAIYFFGLNAIITVAVAVIFACLSEIGARKLFGKKPSLGDGSAIVTGVLLAFTLPPTTPWWMVVVGSFVAIVIAKEVFGGLGANIFNPALIGRAFLMASWTVPMTTWVKPLWWEATSFADILYGKLDTGFRLSSLTSGTLTLDAITSPTPLALVKPGLKIAETLPTYASLFFGNIGGSLGETSALALLIGGLYLLYKGHITWHIPVSYIATVGILMALLGQDPLYHILAGGLILGAFFMATDWVTSPITNRGRVIFGIGAGVLVVAIRLWGGYPEGVAYSILLMNAATPLIDKYVKPRRFGQVMMEAK
jgi:electron transport complex protein RnfD